MRLFFLTMMLVIAAVIITVIIVLMKPSMHNASLTYVDNLRHLLINGSFTAIYSNNYVSFSTGSASSQVSQCNETTLYSIGSINGTRAILLIIKNSCLPPNTIPISTQEIAYWVNGTSMCNVVRSVFNNYSVKGKIQCLPHANELIKSVTPFREFLGNITITLTTEGCSINYTMITHIHYVNATEWHGQKVYCFQVISESIYGNLCNTTETTFSPTVIQKYHTEKYTCLLPNGLPAITIFNNTIIMEFPQTSTTTYIDAHGTSELISYELNYFNATAFNELLK